MKVEDFVKTLAVDFYVGVPDSLLKPLGNYLMHQYGIDSKHHIVGANEGNCVAIASGYNLATSKIPAVYLQNSGEGNIINPIASLVNDEVYGIPMIFIIGWRGEPDKKDEPQHIYQGKVTLKLLDVMNVQYFIINQDTTQNELTQVMSEFRILLEEGKCVAFVISKGGLSYGGGMENNNSLSLLREDVVKKIVSESQDDLIISTTGKVSRELYEARELYGQGHERDFLTVGSMGHSSSIALGVALNAPHKKIWCIDGDGAVLMHMGAMATIGTYAPGNLIHILVNNGAHESVGGMPTVAFNIDFRKIATACGYKYVDYVEDTISLENAIKKVKSMNVLSFIEVRTSISSRADLSRPKEKPKDNKELFIRSLRNNL